MTYRRLGSLKTVEEFEAYTATLGIDLPVDHDVAHGPDAPLAQPFRLGERIIGNRFCALPMEGWDGTADGQPTGLTVRRWAHFGQSGAKLIWGGEAVAVRPDGRANPNQLLIHDATLGGLERLRRTLVEAHVARMGRADDLLVGLQLTHSGRYARPHRKDKPEPVIAYHHPLLDARVGIGPDYPVISDGEIERLIVDFVRAGEQAHRLGFDFVDIKHCHGYLGHELLSARTRPGPLGGDLANRTRFLREVVAGLRAHVPHLLIGVRVSIFDFVPFTKDPESGRGVPQADAPYPYGFGCDPENPLSYDLTEPVAFLRLLEELGIRLVCLSAGSPYYNPHIQRPAFFPPSDGYLPPEDPLVGVARQLNVVAQLKSLFPNLAMVGSGYTYLQDYLAHAAQYRVRTGQVDFVGLGRMLLSYPEYPNDILTTGIFDRKRLCRTFSDCTTAPRCGLVSGCYPLDAFYGELPEAQRLREFKARKKTAG
ncbi:MAG: NADH:flavin oxidoreductase [Anaerolineae bacterium]|nr:NADH:flavin oxidoreductase [Anaerolineae bacterium]